MFLLPIVFVCVIDASPKVWIVDMAALPAKSPVDYRLTITIALLDGETGDLNYTFFKTSTPEEVQCTVFATIYRQKGWKVDEDGLRIILREAEGKLIRRITFDGDGPKPAVRWEFAPPPKK